MTEVIPLPRRITPRADLMLPPGFVDWTASKQDAVWRYRDFLRGLTAQGDRESIAHVIYNEGAYCGDCEYEGWDSCSECRRTVLGYADALISAGYRLAVNPL